MIWLPSSPETTGDASIGGAFPTADRCRGGRSAAFWHFTSRHGGCSAAPFDSLNVGLHVGDQRHDVIANRSRLRNRFNLDGLLFLRQTHGVAIHIARRVEEGDERRDFEPPGGCDAAITNCRGLGLAIQNADCQGVLLYDPVCSVIAGVHVGWRGSVAGILDRVVRRMQSEFCCDPKDLHVRISPALGPCCAEFIDWRRELPESFLRFRRGENHFDFLAISAMQLTAAGVPDANIAAAGVCTSCSDDHFSWRRAVRSGSRTTGRNCSIVYMSEAEAG